MSVSLTGDVSLQTRVRELDRETDLDLTAVANIAAVNAKLFLLASIIKEQSLRRQATLTTVENTETVTWTATVFDDVTLVELQDPDDAKFKMVIPATSELEWQTMGLEPNGFPLLYLRQHDGTNRKIALRPIPPWAASLRITGYIEPTKFTSGGSETTPWLGEKLDEALASMIAAERQHSKNDPFYANSLASAAAQIIARAAGRELTPEERAAVGVRDAAA